MVIKRLSGVVFFVLAFAAALQAQLTLLHSFGGAADGMNPYGALIAVGNALYGTTCNGGTADLGTVFKINKDGTGYAVLHSFTGSASDGAYPYGSLLAIGPALYGMTLEGGAVRGTIFKINKDGTGYAVIHSFIGDYADGDFPYGTLIKKGAFLYGMSCYGGENSTGCLFRVKKDGTGFTILHSFWGGTADGQFPNGSLIAQGSALYGMTKNGGVYDRGVVFKIKIDGTGFALLHSFVGGDSGGWNPYGSLVRKGSILYGMTRWGGPSDEGVIFMIKTNGADFGLLHAFAGGDADGAKPYGSLILAGKTLYGMTRGGGGGRGDIFRIGTNGSGFEKLHNFAGSPDDGRWPYGTLLKKGKVLYGLTYYGGATNTGAAFSFIED